jgi:bifunctional ADP-heptose synthase (sugar kinase/adenylyltransferase)
MADEQASPNCSQTSLLNNSFSEAQPTGKGSQQMSALELRLLEYEQQIQRLEFENAKIREQQIILRFYQRIILNT